MSCVAVTALNEKAGQPQGLYASGSEWNIRRTAKQGSRQKQSCELFLCERQVGKPCKAPPPGELAPEATEGVLGRDFMSWHRTLGCLRGLGMPQAYTNLGTGPKI